MSLPGPSALGAPIEIPVGDVHQEIRTLEDMRDATDGRLFELLAEAEDEGVRARAATALGRMPFPEYGTEVTAPLCQALEDASPRVRAAVAFALGCREDPDSADVLLSYWSDSDPEVRARIVEAAARVETPPIRTRVLRSLQDPELVVRLAALRACALWDRASPDARDVDSTLLNAMSPYSDATGQRLEPDPEIVWLALFALSRRSAETGRGAFLEHVDSEDARARIFAVRGLSRIEPSQEGTRALVEALADDDWRVATEAAVGLGGSRQETAIPPLLAAIEHDNPHVRRRAVEGLRHFPTQSTEILPLVWRSMQDLSGSVRAAALLTLAKLTDGAEASRILAEVAEDRDPVVRAGVARAASEALESFRALPLLEKLAADPAPFVSTAALDGLKRHPTPRARAILLEYLESNDNGRRLQSILSLSHEENGRASDVPALIGVLNTSTGDVSSEIAFNALRSLGELGGDEAREAVAGALEHDNPFVRRVATQVLERDFGVPTSGRDRPRPARSTEETPLALPGRDYSAWKRNPIAEIVTSRGTLTFELLSAETPVHVYNFVQLARDDHYDGLSFHRVVPDFVIQGGDYRGDGNGSLSWRGTALGQEFTPRPYVRGSLGMPRNEDFDSGGSQFFVTHRDTPHLDGRYTLFGVLLDGGEVLDSIEVGDAILDVRITE